MGNCYRIEVYPREFNPLPFDEEIRKFLGLNLQWITKAAFYQVQGNGLSKEKIVQAIGEVFSDPITSKAFFTDFDFKQELDRHWDYVAEISYLPGVTDNAARMAKEALGLLYNEDEFTCSSGTLLFIKGEMPKEKAYCLACEFYSNSLVEKVSVMTPQEFQGQKRFARPKIKEVKLSPFELFKTYDFNQSIDKMLKLNKEKTWALNEAELMAIRHYYQNPDNQKTRKEYGPCLAPTDVEMEILAQTWSEHCKHKIFAAKIDYTEGELPLGMKKIGHKKIDSLYRSYIQRATEEAKKKGAGDLLVSVFSDNAGIVRFSEKIDVAVKVETHNSPSALAPYGGALTGIVGVNRDILGVGLGARPIGNINVLCFAPPSWPSLAQADELPCRLLHPKRILDGVHKGIKDGGNKSGIATINGSIYFDYNYAGKPLVYCGTIGVIPQKSPSGRELSKKYHQAGDRVIIIGGRTGVDGIHGATFSSMELDESAPTTAVQIGDPFTQRRVTDFMMAARDRELFQSVTDNGAGGLSSSVGEMAQQTGGATIDLAKALVKYPGIRPFELAVSESQERMTFAVSPDKKEEFLALARDFDIEAQDLGEFTSSGFFEIYYDKKIVGRLHMDFLHEGLPQMELRAHFQGERFDSFKEEARVDLAQVDFSGQIEKSLKKLLSAYNIASKEKWVRQYDHEVQAATLVRPFVGPSQEGPGNAGVLSLFPHGGKADEALAVAHGMRPRLSYYDTYLMAQYAVDEAVCNLICQGVNPHKMALVDNFCWPDPIDGPHNPDGHHKLAQLVRSCQALVDMSKDYGLAYVSGKDSMKNDFKGKLKSGKEVKISVPPTLLITAIGHIDDASKIVTSDFKEKGHLIYLLGQGKGGLKYSEWSRYFMCHGQETPPGYIDPKESWELYLQIATAMEEGIIQSCHDISDGGPLTAISECCFGGDLGAEINTDALPSLEALFGESASRFIISLHKKGLERASEIFGKNLHLLGKTKKEGLTLKQGKKEILAMDIRELKSLWKSL